MSFLAARSRRIGPFHGFDADRFADINRNGFSEYLDSISNQTAPYLYLSSYGGSGYRTSELVGTGMKDVYRQENGPNAYPWKAESYQIISPGRDGRYGTGGYFNVDEAAAQLSSAGHDNVTNFHRGPLVE